MIAHAFAYVLQDSSSKKKCFKCTEIKRIFWLPQNLLTMLASAFAKIVIVLTCIQPLLRASKKYQQICESRNDSIEINRARHEVVSDPVFDSFKAMNKDKMPGLGHVALKNKSFIKGKFVQRATFRGFRGKSPRW